ncbi:MAG: CerR family C-terminal domain-containing protein [Pacificimonas sp.]|nr:CerR family C-terminal domain-containing protein [Pacificimonas sp.]
MRDRLIQIAIEKFGQRGFEGVGTREIAAEAGTAMSSITYHFGGKDGLYEAAADHILSVLQSSLQANLQNPPGEGADREVRLMFVVRILRAAGQMMLREETGRFALFISREQQSPSSSFRKRMAKSIHPIISGLVGQIAHLRTGLSPQDMRATGLYLFGMAVTLRHSRATLLAVMETDAITPELETLLLDRIEDIARAALREPES